MASIQYPRLIFIDIKQRPMHGVMHPIVAPHTTHEHLQSLAKVVTGPHGVAYEVVLSVSLQSLLPTATLSTPSTLPPVDVEQIQKSVTQTVMTAIYL